MYACKNVCIMYIVYNMYEYVQTAPEQQLVLSFYRVNMVVDDGYVS